MVRAKWIVGLGALCAMAASPVSSAQTAGPRVVVDVTMKKEIVVRDAQGKETVSLQDAASASPGDTLVFHIDYSNQGGEAAHDARVVDPVPSGTQLIPESWTAPNADLKVSVDGGRTFESYPVRRPLKQADGSVALTEVAASAYTHLRWTPLEPLAPGDVRSASFKVMVR